ncbi:MAG: arginine deiminase family protein [Candidatus Micrarchaeota archaeon]
MSSLKLNVKSETGKLKKVVIGCPHNFHSVAPEIVNEKQRVSYGGKNKPTVASLQPEFKAFKDAMEKHGVEVLELCPVEGVPDQLTPRDIAFVIGDTLVISGMAKASRKNEFLGLGPVLETMDPAKILKVPGGIVLEGGDVVFDKGIIFVGISQRTTMKGAQFLQEHFPDYQVVPVHLKSLGDGEDILHLDCAFLPFGNFGVFNLHTYYSAFYYPDGFEYVPPMMSAMYRLIEVTREEQQELAINILSLSHNLVISRDSSTRVNQLLTEDSVKVIPIQFNEAPKTGGSFRCCSLPLVRE